METPLQKELDFFESKRKDWLATHPGQFAVVHGEVLLGFYPTFAVAYDAGVTEFGLDPFLVQQVTDADKMAQFPALAAGLIRADL